VLFALAACDDDTADGTAGADTTGGVGSVGSGGETDGGAEADHAARADAEAEYAAVALSAVPGLLTRDEAADGPPLRFSLRWLELGTFPSVGEALAAEARGIRDAFAERMGEPPAGSPIVPAVEVEMRPIAATDDLLGVRIGTFELPGAGGANFARTLWFDLAGEAAAPLPAVTLLRDQAALARVAALARAALADDRPDLSLPDALEAGTAAGAANYDALGFTAGGDLLVEFDEYQVGPGASGAPRVVIPITGDDDALLSDFGRRAREAAMATVEHGADRADTEDTTDEAS